jgi:hypothetical protein
LHYPPGRGSVGSVVSQTAPLSPEQEQQVVDAITALDWSDNCEAARQAVTRVLSVTDQLAGRILDELSERRITRMVVKANNFLETGTTVQSPLKWIRAGIPTALELIRQLMALEGFVTLDRSRKAVSQFCGCSIDEANRLLYDLRDRNILTLTGEGSTWRWCRASGAV